MRIVPFLSESENGGFVIFKTDDGDRPHAYIWVGRGEVGSQDGIKITSLYGLASYFTHTLEPMFVCSKVDDDVIDRAVERLEKCPKDALQKLFDGFNEDIKAKEENAEGWNEYREWEEEAEKAVERAEESGDGSVIF